MKNSPRLNESKLQTPKKNQSQEQEKSSLAQLITDPLHLKLLILAGTDLKIVELQQINACVNLMKLDISSNNLHNLPKNLDFGRFANLKLLYLHNNNLSDMESLNQIFKCKEVIYLTLFRNPLSELNSIRHYIINSMPNLKCFDFNLILDEERSNILIANDNQSARYLRLSKIQWPLVEYPNDENLTEKQYLNILYREISIITTQHRKCSFIITIQRFIKGYIIRQRIYKLLQQVQKKENTVIKYAKKWKNYAQKKRELKEILTNRNKQYLLVDANQYRYARAMSMLSQLVQDFKIRLQQKRVKQRAARILLRAMNGKKAYFHSYDEFLKLQNNSYNSKTPLSIYFRQDQINLIDNDEFKKFMILFSSDSSTYKPQVEEFCNNIQNYIIKNNPFQIFRIPDSDSLNLSSNPLIQLMKPSLHCKLILRKKQGQQQDDINQLDKYYNIQRHPILMKYQRIVHIREKYLIQRYNMSKEERQKFNLITNKVKDFQDTQDSILYEIKFPHIRCLSYFLRTIIYMNQDIDSFLDEYNNGGIKSSRKDDNYKQEKKQKILVFFSVQLQRVSSAIKIQQVWRQYVIQKLMKRTKINPYFKLLEHHASSKIQRWIKKLAYIHKTNFMKDIYHHITNVIKTKQLFIHEQIYLNLLNYSNKKQYYNFNSGKNALFSFHQQNALIYFSKKNDRVVLRNLESSFIPSVFPFYIKKIFYEQGFDDSYNSSFMQGDIYHALHVGCKITRHEIGPMNYIQIDFPSLSQAIYRTAIIALKTYTFRSNGAYIKLQPYHHILDCTIILPYEERLQSAYRIKIEEIEGRDKHQVKKEIDNKSSMFICSDFQKQFIAQGIDSTSGVGQKQIHMFTNSVNNKPPQKLINNLLYFLSDNIYMNLVSDKQEIYTSQQKSKYNSNSGQKHSLENQLSERNLRLIEENNNFKNDKPSMDAYNQNISGNNENLQNYSQNLFISQYCQEEEKQLNQKIPLIQSSNKNDSTAAQSRNSSVPYVSQRESHRRSQSSLVVSNNPQKQLRCALIKQQDLQLENENGVNGSFNDGFDDTYCINFQTVKKLNTSSTKGYKNSNENRVIKDSIIQDSDLKQSDAILQSPFIQNDLFSSNVIKSNFKDSKEISQYLIDREQGNMEIKKQRVILQKERQEDVKELNFQLQQIRISEKIQNIKKARKYNEIIRTGEIILQQQQANQKAQQIRNHSSYAHNNDSNRIENSLMKNTNFLNKQISQFQSKRNKQDLFQQNQMKAQNIKNKKLLCVMPQSDKNINKSLNQSLNLSRILNQSDLNQNQSHNLFQSIIPGQQISLNHLNGGVQIPKIRSQSICDKTLISSQIIVNINKNEGLNNSALYSHDDSSLKGTNNKLPSIDKAKQMLTSYLQNSQGYNPQGNALPFINQGNENSPSKLKNESITTNVKVKQYQGSQTKKRNVNSYQKERIIHSVFPEEFYPLENGKTDNQFLFEYSSENNRISKVNKLSHLQHSNKK